MGRELADVDRHAIDLASGSICSSSRAFMLRAYTTEDDTPDKG